MKNLVCVIFLSLLSFQAQASVSAARGVTGEVSLDGANAVFTVKNPSDIPIACQATLTFSMEFCTTVEYQPGKPKKKCKREKGPETIKIPYIPAASGVAVDIQMASQDGSLFAKILETPKVSNFVCKDAIVGYSSLSPEEVSPEHYLKKLREEQAKASGRSSAKPDSQSASSSQSTSGGSWSGSAL